MIIDAHVHTLGHEKADDIGTPGVEGEQDRFRSTGGIQDVGELFP